MQRAQELLVQSLGWEDPLEEGMATHPVFLPGKFHGQRSLVGYSLRDHKDSDTTERLNTRTRQAQESVSHALENTVLENSIRLHAETSRSSGMVIKEDIEIKKR